MPTIESITHRRIINSHVAFATEFAIRLNDGAAGWGAAPEGETISIYEDRKATDPDAVIDRLRSDELMDRPIDQESWDDYLSQRMDDFGRNTCFALSLALCDSARNPVWPRSVDAASASLHAPKICFNILNGGRHAYTNPVLSDFPEYLLVAKGGDIEEVVRRHNDIQRAVSRALIDQPKRVVSGNPVSCFAAADNRECIEFLLGICEQLGCSQEFELMIDASAGDLWSGDGYRLSLTDDSLLTGDELRDYWLDLIRDYPLRFLEDPFSEKDRENWASLVRSQEACLIIGDNFYSSDAAMIARGAAEGCTHGAIIKPNQAGTVTAVCRSFETAKRSGQVVIASHRSISTESTLVATLACVFGADYIKVGPLLTDYSSVMRVNEMIRLTGEAHGA